MTMGRVAGQEAGSSFFPSKRAKTLWPRGPKAITSYRSSGVPSTSIPGDPTGIPGTASPRTEGRCSRSLRIAEAGTCPSMTKPSISAVWQDARADGTPSFAFKRLICPSSTTVTAKPFARKWSAQAVQHPQFGSLVTVMPGDAARDRARLACETMLVAAKRRNVRREFMWRTSVVIRNIGEGGGK